ncbi:MAG: type II toxin-antitoxin system VapC family toxin [bacterium]|nr:type II toxin-antitoxin system VapC family toxin [bacterium]
MINLVVDASVAAKWFLEEEYSESARKFMSDDYSLHVPDYFFIEIDNVLWKKIGGKVIKQADARNIRSVIRKIPFHNHPTSLLLDAAFELATKTGLSVYDCIYLSLAIQLETRLVTADKKLCELLKKSPVRNNILWVEDVEM